MKEKTFRGKTFQPWSKKEDNMIREVMSQSKSVSEGFNTLTKKIKRTRAAIANRHYLLKKQSTSHFQPTATPSSVKVLNGTLDVTTGVISGNFELIF
jgi:hypothetical protein